MGRPRSRWSRPRWALPRLGLALAPIAAVIVLVLAGTFSGPDDSGTQPAAAAVLRTAKEFLNPSSGSIFVEDESISGPGVHGHPFTLHEVLETPAHGPQNGLSTTNDPAQFGGKRSPVAGTSYIGGTQEIYLPSTNTIYASSIWGPYLHKGPRPGTYVYRYAPGAVAYTTHPILLTARQRQRLLSGRLCLRTTGKLVDGKVQVSGLKALPPLRFPSPYAQTLQEELANKTLHLVGRTTVNGRAAIEIAGKTTDGTAPELHMYFDPTTRLPFEEVDSVGTSREQVIQIHLRKVPITSASKRLLSLQAMYPTARVVRSAKAYMKANVNNLEVFTQ